MTIENNSSFDSKIRNISLTIQSSTPEQWQIDRSKIRAIISTVSFNPEEISFLIQLVANSLKSQNNAIRKDVFHDFTELNLLNISSLQNLPKNFPPSHLLEIKIGIAKKAIEADSKTAPTLRTFSRNIRDYNIDSSTIEGQNALIDIAKFAAQKDGSQTSQFIENYAIDPNTVEGQNALIKIAELAVQKNADASEFIQNYKINCKTSEGQLALIQIAKLSAQQEGATTSAYIDKYGIDSHTREGQIGLIEIAMLAIQKDRLGLFMDFFQNYAIDSTTPDGQRALIEIAKLAAQDNGGKTSKFFKKFGIDSKSVEGQKALIEIAKLAVQNLDARNNVGWTSEFIQNYSIDVTTSEGRVAMIEIAKIAAKCSGLSTSKFIQNYAINATTSEGQATLIDIAKIAAQNDGGPISEFIQNYKIDANTSEGQTSLIEIAKIAAQRSASGISKFIQNFAINKTTPEGQATLIEIAKLAVKQVPWQISEFIQNYAIDATTLKGQASLIEIAKIAAEDHYNRVFEFIQNYAINLSTSEGQAALIEIAKLTAKRNGVATSINIQKFGIETNSVAGQNAMIEIAKLAAPWGISEFIKNYGIDANTWRGQAALIEIAKMSAKNLGGETSKFIQNYAIDANTPVGQVALIEIAKLAAQYDGGHISTFIQKYAIDANTSEGQLALIEIAKLAAQNGGGKTSKLIQNYSIVASTSEGQIALIDIAKLAAQNDGSGTSEFIQNYPIDAITSEGQIALIDIAKLAAQNDGSGTSEFIQKYRIDANTSEGQLALIEIAKLAAQNNGGGVSIHIQKYRIDAKTSEGQLALIEIAKLAAQKDCHQTSRNIQNYGIYANTSEGQKALIEIAKIAAQKDGVKTSAYIQKYEIDTNSPEGQVGLIEIAKFAILNNFKAIQFIKNYGLNTETKQGQKVLISFIKFYVQKNSIEMFPLVSTDLIKPEVIEWATTFKMLSLLYLRSLPLVGNKNEDEKTIQEAFKLINNRLQIFEKTNIMSEFFKMWERNRIGESMLEFCESIWPTVSNEGSKKKSKLKITKIIGNQSVSSKVKSLMDQIMSMENEQLKISTQIWLITTIGMLTLENITIEEMETIVLPLVEAAFKIKDPLLREDIANQIIFNFVNQEPRSVDLSHTQFRSNQEIYIKLNPKPMAILPCCFFTLLIQQGVEIGDCFIRLQNFKSSSGTPFLKDAHFNKRFLRFLDTLLKQDNLTTQDKGNLLKIVFDYNNPSEEKNIALKERILATLATIMGLIELKQIDKLKEEIVTSRKALEVVFSEAFLKIVPIRLGIDNLALKLEENFEKFRDPQMIFSYAAKLFAKGQKESLQALAEFLESIIDNNFPQIRYQNSPHLISVFDIRPDMEAIWKNGEQRNLGLILEKLSPSQILPSSSPPIKTEIHEFLLDSFNQGHVQTQFYPFLSAYLKVMDQTKRDEIVPNLIMALNNTSEAKQNENLALQLTLIKLVSSEEDPINLITEAVRLLPDASNKSYSIQFDADIKGLLNMAIENKKDGLNPYQNWKITDTDNLVDLFSCGTEVEGSCQNINGSANLNKCLMAYVLDGKNRLLAIKDINGKIKARSILRLLIDSTTKQPVLFLERIYPKIHAPEIKQAIINMARKRSQALNVVLLSSEVIQERIPYNSPLISLGSKAPFEYVDAGDGVTNGIFTIATSYIL